MRKKHCRNEAKNAPTTRHGTGLRRSAVLTRGMLFAIFTAIDEPFKAHVHVILCRFWLRMLPGHTHTCHSLPPKKRRGFMQIYTENRFCLPLFYLIVLGVALSVLSCPDKGVR